MFAGLRRAKSHDDGGDVGDPRHDSDARDRVTGRSRLSGSRATTAIQGTSPHMVPRTTRASRPACRVRDRTHQPISVIRDLDLRLGQRRWSDGKTAVVVGVAAPVLSGVNCEDAGVLCVSRSRRVLGPQTRPGAGTAPRPLPPPGEEPSSGLYPSDRHLKDATRVRASMRGWWEIPSTGSPGANPSERHQGTLPGPRPAGPRVGSRYTPTGRVSHGSCRPCKAFFPMLTSPVSNNLESLRHDVGDARLELNAGRAAPRNQDAQRGLLDALEKYAFALAAAGRPVPYRMRDDLVLYRKIVTVLVASSRAVHVAPSYPLGIWHASSARPALVRGI